MASKPILYSFHLSSCAWRVRIVLALKNVDYEYKTVKLMTPAGGDQYTEEFKKHNPMSQVPVLEVDGKNISQSVAIMEYLEETYPQPRLLPADPYLRAKTREITELLVSGVQPLQSLGLIPKLGKEEWQSWAKFYITKGFTALEAIVTETAGKYCVGDEITLADACLVPQMSNAQRWGIDVSPFPILVRICAALEAHPLVKKAHPSCQPDAQADA
uniref:maleylacetoacetate isomerase n=1 Tax=Ixodes ricinus TaxID=34613 RepID=A0A0K8RFZ1_IXORI